MAIENPSTASGHGHFAQDEDYEQEQLLSYHESPRDASPDSDIVVHAANQSHAHSQPQFPRPGAFLPRRQSSFAQPRPAGTPRTTNRVHFDVEDSIRGSLDNASLHDHDLMQEEDYLTADNWSSRRHNAGQRAPLLTNIEAPSVTVAESDFNPDDLLESARPKSSMSSAFMNMANSIIGAGIIGQPYALRQAGLLTGVVLLIVLTITVDWTIRLIVTNSKLSGTNSFQATVEHCYGKSGLVAISIAQWAFMLIIVITVITQGPSVPAEMKGPIKGSLIINNGVFQAIGVISFAFVCHHNSLLIYGSLQKPTMDRFAKVTHYSTSISMLACLAMALSGYLNFGSLTQGNVLNNFPTNNMLVNIARLCFGLNMLTTLPLEAFVCREVMNLYYFSHEPFDPNRHLILTTALVISAMGLSLLTCDLGIVFELVGATSACALAYILPPLCYVKLTQRRTWETWAAYVCIAFGCVVMGISVLLAGAKMVRGEGGAQTC
ncbi:putative amino acid transporter [Aureobasidium subglaciale]|nr:putative amino acid transporter [Aureobasidium subglaciale]